MRGIISYLCLKCKSLSILGENREVLTSDSSLLRRSGDQVISRTVDLRDNPADPQNLSTWFMMMVLQGYWGCVVGIIGVDRSLLMPGGSAEWLLWWRRSTAMLVLNGQTDCRGKIRLRSWPVVQWKREGGLNLWSPRNQDLPA